MRQLGFSFLKNYRKEFGGSLLMGKRKTKRPLSTKHPIHLIIKSDHKNVFKPTNLRLEKLLRSQCEKFGIKLYDFALNWSHIHCVIQIKSREDYKKFIRSFTSILADKIRAHFPELKNIFTLRPFTRVLSWGKDFKNALQYQIINQLESLGLISRSKKQKIT